MKKLKLNKKAYYYTLDALIALAIIFAVLLVIKPISREKTAEIYLQEDTISVLSTLKTGEIDNSYVKQLISEGKITNLNISILEQIAELYAKDSIDAKQLSENILTELSPKENIGIWFNNELIASYNSSPIEKASNVYAARQIVSGIEKPEQGKELKGYTARAFLTRANQLKYFYFGGYVGDGNISIKINYNGTIKSAIMELAINNNFSLYINNNFIGNLEKNTSIYYPQAYSLPIEKFAPGENLIELKGSSLFIAGGHIKLSYDGPFSSHEKYFPGVSGLINIYDSFYIPSSLESMNIFLHYSSPYRLFLNIGNKTIYEGSGSDVKQNITNEQLSSLLNYQEMNKRTIPLRLGLYELKELSRTGNADVILITDLSGSMDFKMESDNTGITRSCDDPALYNTDTKRISVAKCLDKMFVDMILNVSGNRLALSAFYGDSGSPFKGRVYEEGLTTDAIYLKQKIDAYNPQGGTCICCSINDAYKILNEQGDSSKKMFVVVMSDGIPTHTCQSASGCKGTRTGLPNEEGLWLGYGAGCYGGLDDCNVNDCSCASQNTNWSSCRLSQKFNATLYSIGFGPVSSCDMANKTLRNIANCGQGKYYSAFEPEILKEIYSSVAREILELGYIEQLSNVSQAFNLTELYPDSYISLVYNKTLPYGMLISSETGKFGNEISQGSFSIPEDSEPIEAIAVSYSGSKWTDKVEIINSNFTEKIFDLASYGSEYLNLGDPYFVYIPGEKLVKGENTIKITTATSPSNSSSGSPANKAIYTILKQALAYSPILYTAKGCIWTVEFFDSTNLTTKIPQNYTGDERCYYTSASQSYNTNDAFNSAVYNLLKELDFNLDFKLDSKFSEQDLSISSSEISGVPFLYSSEVQVRVWR